MFFQNLSVCLQEVHQESGIEPRALPTTFQVILVPQLDSEVQVLQFLSRQELSELVFCERQEDSININCAH